ncbi:hypothetical protein MTO96_010393 [Rhipicephalus appendiculatus]
MCLKTIPSSMPSVPSGHISVLYCPDLKGSPGQGLQLRLNEESSQKGIMSSFPGSMYERFLVDVFIEADTNTSGVLNVVKLRAALAATITYQRYRTISLKTAAMLMSLVDIGSRGVLNMRQFFLLHRVVNRLWTAFRLYDLNNSGWIRHSDIRAALAFDSRLQLSDQQLNAVLGYGEHRRWVSLDQYFQLCALSIISRMNR